ncbi:MAG: glycosyltransferase [Candidatus Lokiarchaeota archaeon]|nr:glycosyltransferase [Candidatus Lokiarchaeota archaeon]
MKNFENFTLGLFFTRDISLEKWYKQGIFKREIKLYEKLSLHFKHIYLFTYGNQNDLKLKRLLPKNISIIPKKIPMNSTLYSVLLPLLNWKLLRKIDIYKSNQLDGAWTAAISKLIFKKNYLNRSGYILSLFQSESGSGLFKNIITKILEKFSLISADQIEIASKRDLYYLKKNLKLKNKNININPNFVDINLFKNKDLKKLENSIVYVGRLEKQKNLFSLINAISNTKFELHLIGEGNLKEELIKHAQQKNSNVIFEGYIVNEEIPNFINKFEVFILPSYYEGMPKSLIEAMACGLPVIGTRVKGIKELIYNNKNGILCDLDSNSIKKAIINLMENQELKKRLGKNASLFIKDNFSFEKIYKNEIIILNKMIREKN